MDGADRRNLTDVVEGFFTGKRYLIHDRDPLYTKEFIGIVAGSGIQAIKLPPRSPNLNAYAERFVRTIKESCLDQMIFFGEDMLRNAIREFVAHYHFERNHDDARLRRRVFKPMNLGNIGMVQTCKDSGFALESCEALGIISEMLRQKFQRNVSMQFGIKSAKHHTHAAFTQR